MYKSWRDEASRAKECLKARLLDAPELAPRVGRFRLVRLLGQGASGSVYEAEDTLGGELVALKILRRSEALALYRFKREFRSLAGVAHPNLVQLYELFAEREPWCFTMELVTGEDFEAHIRDHSRQGVMCDPSRLRSALIQLIQAVLVIHNAGKLHCDLKPSNVRITATGRVVLLDFGLVLSASLADPISGLQHAFDARGGTPTYLAPEIAAGLPPTAASDAYSIGVMLFGALTGALPFSGIRARVLADKQSRSAPSACDIARGVPSEFDSLCAALLEREPARRCSLARALELLGTSLEPFEPASPRSAGALRLVGRNRELAQLCTAYDAACAGLPTLILVRGPSGIGKSALVERFAQQLPRNAVVLCGRCYDRESTPYKAFDEVIDALARYLKTRASDELQALAPRHVRALLRAFPALGQVFEPDRGAKDALLMGEPEWRRHGFGALKELLHNLAQEQPLVIIADDLQWADLDSARLLSELLGPPAAPPLLYIGCHRSEDERSNTFLRALQSSDHAACLQDRVSITLGALDPAAAVEMALQLVRGHVSHAAAAAQRVGLQASGVPIAVRELARYLVSEPAGAGEMLSLATVLTRRFAALTPDAQRTLSLLALAKGPLPAQILRYAFGPELAWQTGVRRLQAAGFVRCDALGSFAIDHDRVREQITGLLPQSERTGLHRALALACEQVEHVEPEWLVEHWRGANDPKRALAYALAAAKLSTRKLAFNRAADLYRLALELLEHGDARHGQVQQEFGEALANAGRAGEAADALLAAIAASDPELEFSLRCRAMQQYLRGGDTASGETLARALFARVGFVWPEHGPSMLLALARTQLTIALRSMTHTEPACGDRHTAFPPEPASPVLAPGRNAVAAARMRVLGATFREYAVADPIRGVLIQNQLHAEALRGNDAAALFAGRAWRAYNIAARRGTRAVRANKKRIVELEAMAAGLQSPYADATLAFVRAAIALLEGRYADIEADGIAALDIFRTRCTGSTWEQSLCLTVRYAGIGLSGPVSRLSDEVPAEMRHAAERGDCFTDSLLSFAMALVLLARDRPQAALTLLTERIASTPAAPTWTNLLLHQRSIDCLLYLGRGLEVWKLVDDDYWPKYLHSGYRHFQLTHAVALTLRARCALSANAERRAARFEAVAEKVARELLRLRRPESRGWAAAITATLAFSRGQAGLARAHMEDAWRAASQQRQDLYALSCRRQLGRIIGGSYGACIVGEVDAALRAQGVADPSRWVNMYLPGFAYAQRTCDVVTELGIG